MRIIIKKLIFIILMSCSFSGIYAQTPNEQKSNHGLNETVYQQIITKGYDKISCHFSYPQGCSKIYGYYGRNMEEIKSLDDFVKTNLPNSIVYVKKIILTGFSSIEGDYYVNDRLSKSRVMEFKKFLNLRYGFSYKYPIIVNWYGEDWAKLKELVSASPLFEKEEVINIIERVGVFDGRERILINLNNGLTYKTLLEDFFPSLRRCEITIEYDLKKIIEKKYDKVFTDEEFQVILDKEKEKAYLEGQKSVIDKKVNTDTIHQEIKKDSVIESNIKNVSSSIAEKKNNKKSKQHAPIVGIKTNLVSWAGIYTWPYIERINTFLPNLSAEVFINRLLSIQGTAEYSNWEYDKGEQFCGLTAYSIEPRIWLNNRLHKWFYCGVYGQIGDFNLQSTKAKLIKENKENCTGTYWSTGISAGAYIPLSRNLGLEIGARGGYINGDAKKYDIENGLYYYNHSINKKGFGLTELNLSISYRINLNK